jgi:hypothetical protein
MFRIVAINLLIRPKNRRNASFYKIKSVLRVFHIFRIQKRNIIETKANELPSKDGVKVNDASNKVKEIMSKMESIEIKVNKQIESFAPNHQTEEVFVSFNLSRYVNSFNLLSQSVYSKLQSIKI